MKVNYQYAGPSMCTRQEGTTKLGLSPDLSRDEKVSFSGRLKDPLVFRDAMLMLREIVISDAGSQKKERTDFFQWLEGEIERRALTHEKNMPGVRESLQDEIRDLTEKDSGYSNELAKLSALRKKLKKEIDGYDVWKDYYKLERMFWQFLRNRDIDLWFVLDPVITVHPDQVSFEAFSVDESIYGCLSVEMDEFELLKEPGLGTTNIDFSAQLAKEMERFRTYTNVELSVNPEGFAVDTGMMPEHVEKKIDLPETWIKGFNQVSSAAVLDGVTMELSTVDMYDICSFMRRHKAHKSPRYMKWILEKGKPVRILFEPFGEELELKAVYQGEKSREEKIWGRRRWLVVEKLLPLAQSFQVKLLGFGMPQFITADLGKMKMTVGFTAWSANDWVKGTSFNIMNGFIGEGNYKKVYDLLKEKRSLSIDDICASLKDNLKKENISGIGELLKRGEGYFDTVSKTVRFRRLMSEPLPKHLYETTQMELDVKELLDLGMDSLIMTYSQKNEHVFTNEYSGQGFNRRKSKTTIAIDEDGQISQLSCNCNVFQNGPRNISAPCSHILALYMISAKFTRLNLEYEREYKINDIMEMVL